MMRPPKNYYALIALSFVLSSCWNPFNPDTKLTSDDSSYATASTPAQVLENLESAYDKQDIDIYKSCLSTDFKFVLLASETSDIGVDMDHDGIRDNWWGYNEEIQYHENLFSRGSSDGVYPAPYHILLNLMIPPESSWQTSSEEGLEDAIIIPCYFDLCLSYASTSDIVSYGTALFYLQKENGVWKILRWVDESTLD